jgi:carboxyvinyl-carboxyphosphonate phosphorylmutase
MATESPPGKLTASAGRARLRSILAGKACVSPASVYDPMSMRIAADLGFELAMLGGSVAALVVLGAPDHCLLSLDEFAGLCRRLCRTGALPLMVDADHGFGNALNAMRCVEELEVAGVAAMTLEDTMLPQAYGGQRDEMISIDEAKAKVAAAVAARTDPAFAILGRTTVRGIGELRERATAYAEAGADAIFLTRARRAAEVEAAASASGLPIVLAAAKEELAEVRDLGALGVRICLRGHDTIRAATTGAWESLNRAAGGNAAKPDDLLARYSDTERYASMIAAYLGRKG